MSQVFLRFSSGCIIFFLFFGFPLPVSVIYVTLRRSRYVLFIAPMTPMIVFLQKKRARENLLLAFGLLSSNLLFIEFSFIEIEVDMSFLHAARCSEGGSQRRENCDKELQNLSPGFLFHCHNRFVFKGLMTE